MTVRFVEEAQQEFLDVIHYYEKAEVGLGRRFSAEPERTVQLLRSHPEIYRIRGADQRWINLKTFPFYLPFIIRVETIWVVAVAHESRRPQYWISRRLPRLL